MSKVIQGPFGSLKDIEHADITKGVAVHYFDSVRDRNTLLGYVIQVDDGFALMNIYGKIISKTYKTMFDMIGSGPECIGEAMQFHQIL